MCRKTTCNQCGKPTWAGCGMHVTSALSGVPLDARCLGWKGGYGNCPDQTVAAEKPAGTKLQSLGGTTASSSAKTCSTQ